MLLPRRSHSGPPPLTSQAPSALLPVETVEKVDNVDKVSAADEAAAAMDFLPRSAPQGRVSSEQLRRFDRTLAAALRLGLVRLVSCAYLLDEQRLAADELPRMQELAEVEGALVPTGQAAALLERADRSVFALSHGWLSHSRPDPGGRRLALLRRCLCTIATHTERPTLSTPTLTPTRLEEAGPNGCSPRDFGSRVAQPSLANSTSVRVRLSCRPVLSSAITDTWGDYATEASCLRMRYAHPMQTGRPLPVHTRPRRPLIVGWLP